MRNWYLRYNQSSPQLYIRRTLPMRNWYRYKVLHGKYICRRYPPSRTLPMRNWYSCRVGMSNDWLKVSIGVGHYLWGIDTFAVSSICREKAFPSDITYEELIQDLYLFLQIQHLQWSRTLPMRNWYISWVSINISSCGCSSDITYEELIRLIVSYLDVSYRWEGRTLPMRNWYMSYQVVRRSQTHTVGHYLWGIDTSYLVCIARYLFCRPVGHYLWGIDT